jgi:tungstate transport system ATP-binding protein
MLAIRDLEHGYGDRTVLSVPVLEMPEGTITALVGPNGSGKSTLLRVLSGVERPRHGTLSLAGIPIRTPREALAARRQITLVEQHPLLFDMSVRANLAYALSLRGERGGDGGRRIRDALALVGAEQLADRPGRSLSGGETQRVAVARAFLVRPRVLLLDEPLSAADRTARALLGAALQRFAHDGTAICLSSHLLEEAFRWSSRLFALVEGRLDTATPENLFRIDLPPGSGSRTVRVGPLALTIVSDREGPVTIALSPDDIVISRQAFASSVRNQFPGRVTGISDDGRGHIRVTADVGTELVVRITPSALVDLGLEIGTNVVLSVKAMAVRIF